MPRKSILVVEVSGGRARARKPERVEWLRLLVGGQLWVVYITDSESLKAMNGGHETEGLTVTEESAIYIDDCLPQTRKVGVLLHELLHVALSMPGWGHAQGLFFGTKDVVLREETLVTVTAPALASALFPFLRFPPAPRLRKR